MKRGVLRSFRPLRYPDDLPCINVGKSKRPAYIPIEHCELLSLQRFTKSLSNLQRTSLVEKSRQESPERTASLTNIHLEVVSCRQWPLISKYRTCVRTVSESGND